MKANRKPTIAFAALLGLTLATAGLESRAQTIITNSYTNTFDAGGNTTYFTGGSVASWLYWYNSPGGNLGMTNDPSMDAGNNPSSGSLMVVSPLAGGTQNVFFGTFDNQWGYDFNTEANLLTYSNIEFDIRIAPGTPPDTNGNFGTIGVGIITSGYSYQEMGRPTIPGSASNNWVHLSVPINKTQDNLVNVPGIAFDINSYGGYPNFTMTNWIDNLEVNAPPAPPPPPPTLSAPQKAVNGLNCIAASAGQYDRDQLCTVASSGYSFVGQPSVTYSWNIKKFPTGTGGNFQQHLFLVSGAPGPYDQAADWNMVSCIFVTVQLSDAGTATCNFRYKTNEPGGNGMLFNSLDKNNGITYPVAGAPTQPAASLSTVNGAIGTWSLTFNQTTNVTITAPDGSSTNFVMDPDAAALFADPVSICLGGQPNNANGFGQAVIYNRFSVTGNGTPFTDNFSTDTALDTNTWKNLSNDTNCAVLLAPDTAYWVGWTLPDAGYTLQTTASLQSPNWVPVSNGPIKDQGMRMVPVESSILASTNQAYFRLIKRSFAQLLVLLPGETNAPGTATGKIGTPDPQSNGNPFAFTVLAVDANWYPIPGVTDTVSITSTDPDFVAPNPAPLVNGSATMYGEFGSSSTGSGWTITATDTTQTNILSNTSSPVSVP